MGAFEVAFDLLVAGGGPAGAAAALTAARRGRRVALITPADGDGRAQLNWLSPAGVMLAQELGLTAKALKAQPWGGVRLHTWDFKKSVEVHEDELKGWLVERPALDGALQRLAEKAGASLIPGRVEDLSLSESAVGLRLGAAGFSEKSAANSAARAATADGKLSGRLLLIASGAVTPLAERAQLIAARPQDALLRCAAVSGQCGKSPPTLDFVLGAGRGQPLATIVRSGSMFRAWLILREPGGSVLAELEAVLTRGVDGGALTGPFTLDADRVEVQCLAGAALDLDQHVGKRALLIGDAGGFVAALSMEGIYPAMRSGTLAAELADRALGEAVQQDALGAFGALWRAELAEYLQLPNIDLPLLLPLIFSNPQMSRRVARALVLGQSF